MRRKAEEDVDLFSDNDEDAEVINPITPQVFLPRYRRDAQRGDGCGAGAAEEPV